MYSSLFLSITLHHVHAIPALVTSAPCVDTQRRGPRVTGARERVARGRWSHRGVGAMSRPLPAVMDALMMLPNTP
jgi:hypothetical protein